jgi:hypothetical protein
MKLRTLMGLAALIATSACHNVDQQAASEKATCTAIAELVQTNAVVLNLVSSQLTEADGAASRWQKWQRKEVSEAEDGTGEFRGAGLEARRDAGAAKAFCDAAGLLHSHIQELARSIHAPAVHAEEREIALQCTHALMIDSPDPKDREANASKWRSEMSDVQQAESRYVEGCATVYGTKRPPGRDNASAGAVKPAP